MLGQRIHMCNSEATCFLHWLKNVEVIGFGGVETACQNSCRLGTTAVRITELPFGYTSLV